METVVIECRCIDCVHWKKKKYLKHDGICLCQVDENDIEIPKRDTDFCNYADRRSNEEMSR